MTNDDATHILCHFGDHTLPKAEWTHDAHLAACWAVVATTSAPDALGFLRNAIRSYNEATGVANTPTSGYHETLTAYFVYTVAGLQADSVDAVLAAPRCRRDAPLRHWSRSRLFSECARSMWVEPDLEPLPPAVERSMEQAALSVKRETGRGRCA
ncbi:MAG: hypothetical protein AAFY28_06930 [Actinomycetota bacterium]